MADTTTIVDTYLAMWIEIQSGAPAIRGISGAPPVIASREAMIMWNVILPTILLIALVVLPLAWRIRAELRRSKADILRADILHAINRRLGGESLLSVQVIPETLGRPGRIVLWTPAGYEDVVEAVWRDVVKRSPIGYDIVVKPGHAGEPVTTPRAA